MDANLESQLKELLDKQNISDTLLNMTRGFNRLDTKLVEAAFHDDAVYEHWQFEPVIGAKAIATTLIGMLRHEGFLSTVHLVLQSNIELRGDVAFSENHALSCQVRKDLGPEPTYYARALRMIHRWERRDGKTWKVAYRTALLDGFELAGELPHSGYPAHAYGKRGPRDITYDWDEALRLGRPYQWT
jgi:ketosteroid isomerase-like protein